ncbi:hypothetical protein JCM16303_000408 [Sporobolomyces ruberrimus]
MTVPTTAVPHPIPAGTALGTLVNRHLGPSKLPYIYCQASQVERSAVQEMLKRGGRQYSQTHVCPISQCAKAASHFKKRETAFYHMDGHLAWDLLGKKLCAGLGGSTHPHLGQVLSVRHWVTVFSE